MNQRTVLGILLLFVITVFTQCTVQKRLYRQGWNVEFNRKHKPTKEDEANGGPDSATINVTSEAQVTTHLPEEVQPSSIYTDSVLASNQEIPDVVLKPSKLITENNTNRLTLKAKSPTKITTSKGDLMIRRIKK